MVAREKNMTESISRIYSCEFFPPKTAAGKENLDAALTDFNAIDFSYISCTYGAGGTTPD